MQYDDGDFEEYEYNEILCIIQNHISFAFVPSMGLSPTEIKKLKPTLQEEMHPSRSRKGQLIFLCQFFWSLK